MRRLHGGRRTSEVWLAWDEYTDREVVLKRSGLLTGESRAMAKFNHPHVIRLYNVVSIDGDDWFAMEYASKGNLAGLAPMQPERVALIGIQIAGALVALHAKGVVHCDVKPANIVIAEDGTAKLTDFGAAYRINETITPQAAAISYTVGYAAPEVIRGTPVPKSDVYSLAVTLNALLEGTVMAEQETDTGSTAERTQPAGRVVMGGSAPRQLEKVLSAMREPVPQNRPDAATARQLLANVPRLRVQEWTAFAIVAAVVACVVLVTVAAVTHWSPFDSEPEFTPIIGDRRTADPCALLDERSFHRFGNAHLDDDHAGFARCDVLVTRFDGLLVDVKVELVSGQEPEHPPITFAGAAGFVVLPPVDNDCRRAVILLDSREGVYFLVSVNADGAAPLCDMANVAAQAAVERLGDGPLPRRSPPLPADSLLWHNACELGNKDAALVLNMDEPNVSSSFGEWTCDWSNAIGEVYLTVVFDRGPPLTANDGQLTRIADHDAIITPDTNGTRACLVVVDYREYSGRDGQRAAEKLRLSLTLNLPTDQLCARLGEIATSVATAL